MNILTITYSDKKGAGIRRRMPADTLLALLPRLRGDGSIRNEAGELVGAITPCDGTCGKPRCATHWWMSKEEAQS